MLGFIQGLTEFLPISSSAHVQIATQLLNLQSISKPALTAFEATIALGTEAAVFIYFFKDIVRIVKAWLQSIFNRGMTNEVTKRDSKLGWMIILGSLPVVLVGLVFKDFIENQLRNLWVASLMLIVFGVVLLISDRIGKRHKAIDKLTVKDGLLFGLGQSLAVIPGVSRSGATISVGLLLGYSRQAAARFSFLLAIPAVVASGLYEFAKSYKDLPSDMVAATAVATVFSFLVGYAVIIGFLRYLNRGSFAPFVIWRILVGLAVIAALLNGALSA
ncbi:MAG: undecaprenyl-diphosphatase UppP [Micrococcales bacterium]